MDALATFLKKCSRCGEHKPLDAFCRNKRLPDGRGARCRGCCSKHYAANIEEKRAYRKNYYAKNAEKYRRQSREYNVTNAPEIKARRKQDRQHDPRRAMVNAARARAKVNGAEFNLVPEDIFVPKTCPLLLIPISVGRGGHHAGSPTIDRINPTKGYVSGNVWVISHRANSIKRDATLKELCLLTDNLKICHGWVNNDRT